MINELLRELVQATLAGSAAIVLLLCIRRPLRARFGALMAYRAWLLVPLAILSVCLPAPSALVAADAAVVDGSFAIVATKWIAGDVASTSLPTANLLAWTWFAGVALCLSWFASRQMRFERDIARKAGSRLAIVSGHGPAVVGWWRSLIVLPEDFRERYTRGERRLVLAHEIAHLRRGDIHAQLLATGLRCLFWFNPLLHYAAGRFRFDQELACDASVLERFPRGRGRYGSAMLKTQLAGFGLPVGCHWQSSHPLKERIEMMKQPLPARTRKVSGAIVVAMLMTVGSYAAWAAQPAQPAAAKAHAATPAATPAAQRLTHIGPQDRLDPAPFPAGVKVSGMVELELLVGVDGKVKDVTVISSKPAGVFDQAAVEAARKWYISPALENGVAIESRYKVPMEFRADGELPNPMPTSVEQKQD